MKITDGKRTIEITMYAWEYNIEMAMDWKNCKGIFHEDIPSTIERFVFIF